ncbi:MAG: hypothetical protein GY929_20270 [Actinomycetia bacterium]|nr:hypothetical protein [Actinomycetes bacterium]
MTTTTVPATISHPATVSTPESRLRLVLAANAVTSTVFGLIGAIAASPLADLLGVGPVWLVRLVSVGLILFGIDVALTARASTDRLTSGALLTSIADWSWVAATVIIIALGALSTTGAVIMGTIALGVADFAVLQLLFRRRTLTP